MCTDTIKEGAQIEVGVEENSVCHKAGGEIAVYTVDNVICSCIGS